MKNNGFIEGTIVATLGIFLVKIIGVIYVIPFNAIIGEQGGALYGYGYNIYQLFLSISSAGFPFAISKITSEYLALGNEKAVKDTYRISLRIISVISIAIFIILFIFAPSVGKLIIGSTSDGNTYQDIAFVIRCVSFAILVVPFLSVTKGFLQGAKYITPYSVSQVIEQVVRVVIILVGSFMCMRVFHFPLKYAIGVSVSAAFFGGVAAYLYLRRKMNEVDVFCVDGKKKSRVVRKEEIIKKIFMYSIPFIVISLINNLYTTVDMILLSRTMNDILHLKTSMIESVVGVYTTWGIKLNNIILAVSTGLVTGLIPNVVSSFTKKDFDDVNDKFNKALQCVLLVIVPMTLFMSLLSKPIWTLFYGESVYGPIIYQFFVYTALFGGVYTIFVNTLQGINKYRLVIITVFAGLFTNAVLDVPFMLLCHRFGFNVSYGAILAALVGYTISIVISLIVLHFKYHFSFAITWRRLPRYLLSWMIFVLIIVLLKYLISFHVSSRIMQIPILMLYGVVSFLVYVVVSDRFGNIELVFGKSLKKIVDNFLKKLR